MEILTLAESIKALKFAGLCTYNYLNTLKLKYWPLLLGALIFLGWNGLQIIFSLNLIASFINDFKVQNSLSSTPIDNLRSIPIYIFSLISFIVFASFIIFLLVCILIAINIANIINKHTKHIILYLRC